jgi:hypothetical protein
MLAFAQGGHPQMSDVTAEFTYTIAKVTPRSPAIRCARLDRLCAPCTVYKKCAQRFRNGMEL